MPPVRYGPHLYCTMVQKIGCAEAAKRGLNNNLSTRACSSVNIKKKLWIVDAMRVFGETFFGQTAKLTLQDQSSGNHKISYYIIIFRDISMSIIET